MLQKWLWIVEKVNFNIWYWYNILRMKTFGTNLERFETCIGLQYNTYIHPTLVQILLLAIKLWRDQPNQINTECPGNDVNPAGVCSKQQLVSTFVLSHYFYLYPSQYSNFHNSDLPVLQDMSWRLSRHQEQCREQLSVYFICWRGQVTLYMGYSSRLMDWVQMLKVSSHYIEMMGYLCSGYLALPWTHLACCY